MNVYWDNETDSIVTEKELHENYERFSMKDYDSFDDYIMACMWFNNGSLTPLESHIEKVKRDLNRFIDFYDAEETEAIQADITRFEKYLEK